VLHRVQQTVRYLGASGADDRHASETARILRQLGADEEVIVAGILHDAAKPANTHLWHRVAGVLLELTPRVRARIASGDSTMIGSVPQISPAIAQYSSIETVSMPAKLITSGGVATSGSAGP